jgi:hypothetical protein
MDLRKNEERFACTNAQHSLTMESNKRAIKLPAAYQLGDATRRECADKGSSFNPVS